MSAKVQVLSLTGALDIFNFFVVYVFVSLSLRIDGSVQYSISLYALLRIQVVLKNSSPETWWDLSALPLLIFHSWMISAL